MKNPAIFPQQTQTFLMPGPAGQLEVMTTFPESDALNGVGIICHPDPRFGGTMHNKVVTTVARGFANLRLATVRFNYRGIGASTGEYGETVGELADLHAIITWVRQVLPSQSLWLAGFSFGSYISARAAQTVKPARLISIAPPVNHYDYQQFTNISCPWLVIQGDQDEVVPCAAVQEWAKHPPSPLELVVMPGASHFFHGRLMELRDIIENR
jgi:uncharacterized protein